MEQQLRESCVGVLTLGHERSDMGGGQGPRRRLPPPPAGTRRQGRGQADRRQSRDSWGKTRCSLGWRRPWRAAESAGELAAGASRVTSPPFMASAVACGSGTAAAELGRQAGTHTREGEEGNEFMRSKQHLKAVELYTGAIALSKKNAIYYCNRAAAYTVLNMCNEAVKDCLKSIEIDPKYSKAYSRLGSAYFAMGNYHDALYKGYLKASELEPNNENVRQNIEATKKKLAERRAPPGQNTHAHQGHESQSWFGGQASGDLPFTVFPPGISPPPEFLANIMNHGSVPGQQLPQHSVNINLNDLFGHANVNGNGQGPTTGGPGNHTPPSPFPANAAVPPAFSFMGSGSTEANCAQQASGEHGVPGAQTDAGVYVSLAGQE